MLDSIRRAHPYHTTFSYRPEARRQWPCVSHSPWNAWHLAQYLAGSRSQACIVKWVDGWRDGWQMDGGTGMWVEINLFFPELAFLLDSGHSHTGWVFSQVPTGREARGEKGKKREEGINGPTLQHHLTLLSPEPWERCGESTHLPRHLPHCRGLQAGMTSPGRDFLSRP